jgi:predicted peroxiredoxin
MGQVDGESHTATSRVRGMEKIVIIIKHAEEEPEYCINPMIMAVNASSSGLHPVVILQSRAVFIARKGHASQITEPELPSLQGLIETFIQNGGRLLVSAPALRKRGIHTDDLIEGAMVVNAGAAMREIRDAKHVLAY